MTSSTRVVDRPPTLDERMAAGRDKLTPSEAAVAGYFLEHREDVAFLSAAVIARPRTRASFR